MLLHLAGKEISTGRTKTWPMCSTWQVTCSPVRISEYISLFLFLWGEHQSSSYAEPGLWDQMAFTRVPTPPLAEVHSWAHSLTSLAAGSHLGYNSAGWRLEGSWTVPDTTLRGGPPPHQLGLSVPSHTINRMQPSSSCLWPMSLSRGHRGPQLALLRILVALSVTI